MTFFDIPGNPYALFVDGVVTEVIYMQDYNQEQIEKELANHTYDEAVSCNEFGQEIYIGYVKIGNVILKPKPYPSWQYDETTQNWAAPVPKPAPEYAWDEETLSWGICKDCTSKSSHISSEPHMQGFSSSMSFIPTDIKVQG